MTKKKIGVNETRFLRKNILSYTIHWLRKFPRGRSVRCFLHDSEWQLFHALWLNSYIFPLRSQWERRDWPFSQNINARSHLSSSPFSVFSISSLFLPLLPLNPVPVCCTPRFESVKEQGKRNAWSRRTVWTLCHHHPEEGAVTSQGHHCSLSSCMKPPQREENWLLEPCLPARNGLGWSSLNVIHSF